jgi:hypothetical protein
MIIRNLSKKLQKEIGHPTKLTTKRKPINPRTLEEKRRHIAKMLQKRRPDITARKTLKKKDTV